MFTNGAPFDRDTRLKGICTPLDISIFPSELPLRDLPTCSLTGFPRTGTLRHHSHCSMYTFIHSFYVCRSHQKQPPTYIQEKYTVAVHIATRRRKAYTQRDVTWFPKRTVLDTAISTTVQCSPQRDTVLFGLGTPAPFDNFRHSNPPSRYALHKLYSFSRDPW